MIWSSRWHQKDYDKHLLKAMTRFIFSGCLMTGRPSILEGDVFFNLICGHCSPNGEESVTRMKLQWWRHSWDLQHTELFWKNKSCYYEMWHYLSSMHFFIVFPSTHFCWFRLQIVSLSLYNLQLMSSGKYGYFRWKEQVCMHIDQHWNLLLGNKCVFRFNFKY